MNKKIFTLLLSAAFMLSALFTANAQTTLPVVAGKQFGTVAFSDSLRALPLRKYPMDLTTTPTPKKGAYILSVDTIFNSDNSISSGSLGYLHPEKFYEKNSANLYVLFVDGDGTLRIDTLSNLDSLTADGAEYNFKYGKLSYKFGAIRHATWCVNANYAIGAGTGQNITWNFNNTAVGKNLEVPVFDREADNFSKWQLRANDGYIYGDSIVLRDNKDEAMYINDWHLSQSLTSLQDSMPLYTYCTADSVLVLALEYDSARITPHEGKGGWRVMVKYVAVNDLIENQTGKVKAGVVKNVLGFTLRKLDNMVLNAHDYNAISGTLEFDPNAKTVTDALRSGKNPFYKSAASVGEGPLTAYEVNDPLWKYGYMQFKHATNGWLYVDTAYLNVGNTDYLRFNYTCFRRDTNVQALKTMLKDRGYVAPTVTTGPSVMFWSNSDSLDLVKADSALSCILDSYKNKTPGQTSLDTVNYGYFSWGDTGHVYYERYTNDGSMTNDSLLARATDSIMENQSKFRVVYNPTADSLYINVYQSRYRYTDYTDPKKPEVLPWWTGSFDNDFMPPTVSGGGQQPNTLFPNTFPLTSNATNSPVFSSTKNYTNLGWPSTVISTADTAEIIPNGASLPLSYLYSKSSINKGQGDLLRDTAIYFTIQDLGVNKIATIGENNGYLPHISTNLLTDCTGNNGPGGKITGRASVPNNLYLIRDAIGRYLNVPLSSFGDSAYWRTPEPNEDPTQIPSYQWVVENIGTPGGNRDDGTAFKLTNREFPAVQYARVEAKTEDTKEDVWGKLTVSSSPAWSKDVNAKIGPDRYMDDRGNYIDVSKGGTIKGWPYTVPTTVGNKKGVAYTSFIPLAKDVKRDQTLGYVYKSLDSTTTNIYSLKYNTFLDSEGRNYLGWNGVGASDSTIYANKALYHDRLYFALEQMRKEIIDPKDVVEINASKVDYSDFYKGQTNTSQSGSGGNIDASFLVEKFGYVPDKGSAGFDTTKIADLRPLVRQAYKFRLRDFYKFNPTVGGHYLTVGEQDNYVMADKYYATLPYDTVSVSRLFGAPYFYLRNTYFNVRGEDYFAMVQRLDTIERKLDNPAIQNTFDDVYYYLKSKFGEAAANKIRIELLDRHSVRIFVAQVEDASAKLKINLRGDGAISVSTFTLAKDEDPIYRRFYRNDRLDRTHPEAPGYLFEFHRMNNEQMTLFENSGADTNSGGGYDYNKNSDGTLKSDDWALGTKNDVGYFATGVTAATGTPKFVGRPYTISFLGIKNKQQFPSVSQDDPYGIKGGTNYAIYVDTAYINRGTGWIKPQYLLAVDVDKTGGCKSCGTVIAPDYTLGRYLFNSAMFAKKSNSGVQYAVDDKANTSAFNSVGQVDYKANISGSPYLWDQDWVRLGFAWAIHWEDTLYVLRSSSLFDVNEDGKTIAGLQPYYQVDGIEKSEHELIHDVLVKVYPGKSGSNGQKSIDFAKLKKDGIKNGHLLAAVRLDDNTHKDWVFSFRYIERGSDDFIIESENEDRNVNNPHILPERGGWIKYQNNVPVIMRAERNLKAEITEGDIMNVREVELESGSDKFAVDNTQVSSAVKVIGGKGTVTILNADGKNVVISNIIGQTVVNTTLASDNAVIAVPTGVAIVSVEGESAVKAIVQ